MMFMNEAIVKKSESPPFTAPKTKQYPRHDVQNPQNGTFTNTFPNAFTNGQTVRTSVTKASVVDADIYNQSCSFGGVQFRASVWSFRP